MDETRILYQGIEYERRFNLDNFEHEVIKLTCLIPSNTTDPKPFIRVLQKVAEGLTRQTPNFQETLVWKSQEGVKKIFKEMDLGENKHGNK